MITGIGDREKPPSDLSQPKVEEVPWIRARVAICDPGQMATARQENDGWVGAGRRAPKHNRRKRAAIHK